MHLRQELESRFSSNANSAPPPPPPRVGHGPQNLFGGIMGGASASSDRLPTAENPSYSNGAEGGVSGGHPPTKRMRTEEPYDRETERERERAVPTPPPPNVAAINKPPKGGSTLPSRQR
jgi:hypothetical protein